MSRTFFKNQKLNYLTYVAPESHIILENQHLRNQLLVLRAFLPSLFRPPILNAKCRCVRSGIVHISHTQPRVPSAIYDSRVKRLVVGGSYRSKNNRKFQILKDCLHISPSKPPLKECTLDDFDYCPLIVCTKILLSHPKDAR